eukprot:TRINITY_DN4042_c0_g1_i1.p1 TRINITY_DN4042_c0_g1~~TRINITY_DN4042_c0_g1_i1.p1  ORF type:complete len:261 (-),score=32.42 TRINITY_DN4042_c0_g1_i1:208-990(-)
MGGPRGRGRDSRSPPRRGGGGGGGGGGYRGGSGGGGGKGRGRDSRSRYSPPPRRAGGGGGGRGRDSRSPPRGGKGRGRDSRSPPRRSRSRGGRQDRKPANEYRIPPPAHRTGPAKETITDEMRKNSFEHNGFLYATMDFTHPQTPCGVSPIVPKPYDGQKRTDETICKWGFVPNGWMLVPNDIDDSVKEQVMAPFDWGTHLLVCENGRAYATQGAKRRSKPGSMEKIWDIEKGSGGIRMIPLRGEQSYWHGKLFMRAPNQ